MGWSVGERNGRDIGYGVPAYCDHPGCYRWIDRGLAHLCGDGNEMSYDTGCGLFFCADHLEYTAKRGQLCKRCVRYSKPFTPTPDRPEWLKHKLEDESWLTWRKENPKEVERIQCEVERFGP